MKLTSPLLALLCGPLACSIQFDGDTTTATTTTTTTNGQSETGVATTGVPTTDTGDPPGSTGAPPNPTEDPPTTTVDATTLASSTGFEFIMTPDGGEGPSCDPFAQDCPRDMKCTWWASGGGDLPNANKCVPLDPDPMPTGAPCTAEGDGFTGIDNCGLGALCWQGECVDLCIGSPREPKCPSDVTTCVLTGDGFGLCIPKCDPLTQLCDADELCVPGGESFLCVPDAGDPAGQVHAPCDFPEDCAPGLLCVSPQSADECDEMATGCCEPFCDINQVNTCEGAGQQCLPLPDPPPAGFEHIGVCSLPP